MANDNSNTDRFRPVDPAAVPPRHALHKLPAALHTQYTTPMDSVELMAAPCTELGEGKGSRNGSAVRRNEATILNEMKPIHPLGCNNSSGLLELDRATEVPISMKYNNEKRNAGMQPVLCSTAEPPKRSCSSRRAGLEVVATRRSNETSRTEISQALRSYHFLNQLVFQKISQASGRPQG